ncbi:hypothetical protein K502DRAFT_179435 [Neoconidiobolus thromboides FSU 785]|nr:hypothetical protein K502DRAFT_179435 [Neoconidiobolus thromboides FSU 785]
MNSNDEFFHFFNNIVETIFNSHDRTFNQEPNNINPREILLSDENTTKNSPRDSLMKREGKRPQISLLDIFLNKESPFDVLNEPEQRNLDEREQVIASSNTDSFLFNPFQSLNTALNGLNSMNNKNFSYSYTMTSYKDSDGNVHTKKVTKDSDGNEKIEESFKSKNDPASYIAPLSNFDELVENNSGINRIFEGFSSLFNHFGFRN